MEAQRGGRATAGGPAAATIALAALAALGVAGVLAGGRQPPTTEPTTSTAPTTTRWRFPETRPGAEERADDRAGMIRELLGYDSPRVADLRVLAAMRAVPRHRFVPADVERFAYADSPLPIGSGQTISQPFIVALMSELLQTKPGDRVLEIGTGSGYQAAVLADMGCEVFTIEIIRELGTSAAERLKAMRYQQVQVKVGDGYFGWKQEKPYDAIIVTCAATHVPPSLIEQLKPGGRMCIPLGHAFGVQDLMVVTKQPDGSVRSRSVIPVRFVPLRGGRERPPEGD